MTGLLEVEIVVRGLNTYLIGRQLFALYTTLPRILVPNPLAVSRLIERTTFVCSRCPTYIVIELDDGVKLTVHLEMTSRLLFQASASLTESSSRKPGALSGAGIVAPYMDAVFDFDGGSRLHSADPRTYGRIRYIEPREICLRSLIASPNTPPETVTPGRAYTLICSDRQCFQHLCRCAAQLEESRRAFAHRHYSNNPATGRLSSVNPNLQNIPIHGNLERRICKLFIAGGTGRILLAADYTTRSLRNLSASPSI